MNKILAIISLTAFLCYGVQSSDTSYKDLRKKVINSGTVVFLNFLDKVKNATEKIVRDLKFRKSRIAIQEYLKTLRDFAQKINDIDRTKDSINHSDLLPQTYRTLLSFSEDLMSGAMIREVTDNFFFPYMNIYRGTFKNETVVEFWTHVESNYLPGAPPIYSKPMDFFSYLLAKAVVKSQLVNLLNAAVNIVLEMRKVDFNELHLDVQMVMNQVREKANEISATERQKEKNDFLVSLRTASRLIDFYWDKCLEQTESVSFNTEYLDSMKRWSELTELKNTNEKYHVLIDPNTWHEALNWIDHHFGQFFNSLGLRFNRCGNEVFGCDRFNKTSWIILKIVVVYSVPVYEKLSESGLGINQVNQFLNRANNIILILEGNDSSYSKQTFWESIIRGIKFLLDFVIEKEKVTGKDNDLFLPLRLIKRVLIEFWTVCLLVEGYSHFDEAEFKQLAREWDDVKTIFINELMKSGELTQEKLEEAQKNFVNFIYRILDKLKKFDENSQEFDERINATVAAMKRTTLRINKNLHQTWDLLVE
ncbi:uncharacterized protein LOC127421577 [Myxocyprinus asiaticus]|uniref:uncharacterized protein LOC127421577 n=1 Tax=Myxocyprinus asiaticus TaxID=70543 RepID=UPI0022222C22|nr:uncharacterized protein LOC127421577 [Myxocyprinus asiaticus]